jgi:hypothetical protein
MGFNDNPIIDKSAERSEESVLETKKFFSLKNGFISREENPDYGVDLDVELIVSGQATRQKFAIQIKSSESFKKIKIDDCEFLKLSFLTSRLGYLSRNIPGLGLIVLFEESERLLYFDYIESVVKRINELKDNLDWMGQKNITIYVPKENILDKDSIQLIYNKYIQLHKNHELLLSLYSEKFNIPSFKTTTNDISKNREELLQIIENYGPYLINEFKFGDLYSAIKKLPMEDITQNNKISFMAAVVYSEIGKPIESNLFIQYCIKSQKKLSQDYLDILEFTSLKNEFHLGLRDINKHIEILKQLSTRIKGPANSITLKINISLLKLYNSIREKEIDKTILTELSTLLKEIINSKIEEPHKQLLIIYQASNYHIFAIKYVSEQFLKFKIKDSLKVDTSLEERIELVKRCDAILSIPTIYVFDSLKYAEETENDLIRAHALHKLSLFFYALQFTFALLDFPLSDKTEELTKLLTNSLNNTIRAYNLFMKLSSYADAHMAITLAYEIKQLALLFRQIELGIVELSKLEEIILMLEKQTGIEAFSSTITAFHNQKNSKEYKKPLRDFTEDEIQYFADSVRLGMNLSKERLPNIINDIKNRQYFENHCDINKYEVIQNNIAGKDIYLYPSDYMIINKQSGLILGKSRNLISLIDKIGINEKQ